MDKDFAEFAKFLVWIGAMIIALLAFISFLGGL